LFDNDIPFDDHPRSGNNPPSRLTVGQPQRKGKRWIIPSMIHEFNQISSSKLIHDMLLANKKHMIGARQSTLVA